MRSERVAGTVWSTCSHLTAPAKLLLSGCGEGSLRWRVCPQVYDVTFNVIGSHPHPGHDLLTFQYRLRKTTRRQCGRLREIKSGYILQPRYFPDNKPLLFSSALKHDANTMVQLFCSDFFFFFLLTRTAKKRAGN